MILNDMIYFFKQNRRFMKRIDSVLMIRIFKKIRKIRKNCLILPYLYFNKYNQKLKIKLNI